MFLKRFFFVLLLGVCPAFGQAQQGQLDVSPSLFSVLAALDAAGFDQDLDSAANHPLRELIRKELAARNIPVLDELKKFYSTHKQRDARADFSQYVSFALANAGPPDFNFRIRTIDLPPDVIGLQELAPLLKNFHQQANLDDLWKRSQPAFDQAIARYHEPVSHAVLEVNSYLRNPTSGSNFGRRFQIYVDLLGPPNQIQTRAYEDDSFVVVTPSPEPQIADVRRAYLFYLLDPLSLKHGEGLKKKKAIGDYAQAAPALESYYKADFLLLATACMVKAVESRLDRSRGPEIVAQALREGFILTPHFAEQLALYEKQEQSLRFFFPEMVEAIDLKKEDARLARVEFAQEVAVRKAKLAPVAVKTELTGPYKTAQDAEMQYEAGSLDAASETFARILQETDHKPLHAKAYYGMARIAIRRKDPETAEKLFRKSLELEPDEYVKAWSLVYLGRLSDAAGERDQAVKYYKDALEVPGASRAARLAADKGVQQTFGK